MDQGKIWEHFQVATGDAFERAEPRYRFLVRQLGGQTHVLNVGVGRGGLEALLAPRGITVSCLDPSESTIERLRTELGFGDRAQVGMAQSMPFADAQFDAVVMSEVIEHLEDEALDATLGEAHRVLRSGGRLLGTVPANERLADLRTVCPHCGEVFHRWGHHQSFTRDRVRTLLEGHGFVVRTLQTRAFPDWRRGPGGVVKSAVRHVLGRVGAPIARPSIYFVGAR